MHIQRRRKARIITIDGEMRPLEEWAQLSGTSKQLIRYRLKCGKSPFEAVYGTPRNYRKKSNGSGLGTSQE